MGVTKSRVLCFYCTYVVGGCLIFRLGSLSGHWPSRRDEGGKRGTIEPYQ
jgi:hypothetical protein